MPNTPDDVNPVHSDPELMNLARTYLVKRAAELEVIDASAERHDFETIRRIGHNMHGSGEMFGFSELTAVGAELQRAVEARDVPGILRLRRRIADFLARADVGSALGVGDHVSSEADTRTAAECDSVLLVDDDEMSRILVTHYLEREGYAVTQASSGDQALQALRAPPLPRLVLLDVVMPGTSGLEVCRRIKGNPVTAAIPVVLLTALGKSEDRMRGMEAGADDFVTKPVSRRDLLARLAPLARRAGRRAGSG